MQKFIAWADARRDLWLDCVRIYLGLCLLARGLLLITNTSTGFMVDMLERTGVSWLTTGLMLHYVMLAHFVERRKLTREDLDELRKLLEDHPKTGNAKSGKGRGRHGH